MNPLAILTIFWFIAFIGALALIRGAGHKPTKLRD